MARAVAVIVAVASAAAQLVGCQSKEEVMVERQGGVDGGAVVKAELRARIERIFTDRGFHTSLSETIVVDRTPRTQIRTECVPLPERSPSLLLDAPGERLAYRCAGGEAWRVVYLRRSPGPPFTACAPIAGDAVDWARVPGLVAARAGLLACPGGEGTPFGNGFRDLFLESRARDGDTGAAAFLAETAALDVGGVRRGELDDWDLAWESLPDGKRGPARAALQAALVPTAPAPALRRALRHADLSSSEPAVVDAIEKLGRSAPSEVIVRYLAQRRPAAAAEIACRIAGPLAANGTSVILGRAELAAIAAAHHPCNLDGVYDRNSCSEGYACCPGGFTCPESQRHACSDGELAALVTLELSRPPQRPWPGGGGFGYELLIAAARAQPKSAAARRFVARVKDAPRCPQ